MLNLRLFATIPLLPITIGIVPIVVSSCSSNIYKIDGSNWRGIKKGSFSNNDYTVDNESKTVIYTNGSNITAENLVIPDFVSINNEPYSVVLGEGCFEGNVNIWENVTLNIFIKQIPKRCFSGAHSLTSITLKTNLLKIDDYAFYDCGILQKINADFPYMQSIEEIGDYAFYNCFIDANFIFSDKLSKIGEYAFYNCQGILSVDLSLCSKINKINRYAFFGCSLIERVYLPYTISEIGDYAFAGCDSLLNAVLPRDDINLIIGEGAFLQCKLFKGFVRLCKFYDLGSRCFSECNNFSVNENMLDRNLDSIPDYAFEKSFLLTNITIPNNIKYIMSRAFFGCEKLSTIDFSRYQDDSYPIISGPYVFSDVTERGVVYISKKSNYNTWKLILANVGLDFTPGHWTILPSD